MGSITTCFIMKATIPCRISRTALARASVDWTKPVFTSSAKATAHYNAIKSWVAMSEADVGKYSAPPGPVDFATAKKGIKDKELVGMLEAFYKANAPPPETHEWSKEDQEQTEHHLAFLRDQTAFNEEALP